jgi:hypothetical protein
MGLSGGFTGRASSFRVPVTGPAPQLPNGSFGLEPVLEAAPGVPLPLGPQFVDDPRAVPGEAAFRAAGAEPPELAVRTAAELFPYNQCFSTIIPFLSNYYPELAVVNYYDTGPARILDAAKRASEAKARATAEGRDMFTDELPEGEPEGGYPQLAAATSDARQLAFISKNRSRGGKKHTVKDFIDICKRSFGDDDLDLVRIHKFPDVKAYDDKDSERFADVLKMIQINNWAGFLHTRFSRHEPRMPASGQYRETLLNSGHIIPFVSPAGSGCIFFFDPLFKHTRPLVAIDMASDEYLLTPRTLMHILYDTRPDAVSNYYQFVEEVVVLQRKAVPLQPQHGLVSRHTGGFLQLPDDEAERQEALSLLTRPDDIYNSLLTAQPIGAENLHGHFFTIGHLPRRLKPDNIDIHPELARRYVYSGRAINPFDPPHVDLGIPGRNIDTMLEKTSSKGQRIQYELKLRGDVVEGKLLKDGVLVPPTGEEGSATFVDRFATQAAARAEYYGSMRHLLDNLGYVIVNRRTEERGAVSLSQYNAAGGELVDETEDEKHTGGAMDGE